MNWKNIWVVCLLISVSQFYACKPDQVGFLNDNLRYGVAELQAVQGSAVSTNPLVANGSSTPITVKLLQVRNKRTGAVVPEFLLEQEFSVYLGQVGNDVTTLDQLQSLIGTEKSPAISVNEIGGKVVITPATENVEPGLYTIDLEVSNISGTKVYNEALDINLIRLNPDSIFAHSVSSSSLSSESDVQSISSSAYSISIEYKSDAENKIIYMWLDKDGNPFNPKKGEIIRRSALPSFADWSPFYSEELTDTAIVYPYPYFKGLSYPVKTSTLVGTTTHTGHASNYRVKGDYTDLGRNINTSTTARFYKPGTHIIRMKLNDIVYKLPNVNTVTITKEVVLKEGAGYEATSVTVDKEKVVNALGLSEEEIVEGLGSKVIFYAIQADGSRDATSTAAAPGQWFDVNGNTISWGEDARLFSEFKIDSWTFNIGQFPDKNVAGDTFTVKQSFVYDDGEVLNEIVYVFNITVQ